jgi:type II secretory pathway pseudopilin PulG
MMKNKKGFLSMGFIIGAIAIVSLLYFIGTQKEQKELAIQQQQYLKTLTEAVGSSGGSTAVPSPTSGKYSYANAKPYVNWNFEDGGGTARSPTCYFYYDSVSGSSSWGDERAWTDDTGEYDTSGSASSGRVGEQFDAGREMDIHCDLSSYKNVFITDFVVPLRGDMTPGDAQDSNIGITAGTYKMLAWDTDVWNASFHIDMGYSGSFTAQEKENDQTTIVDDNKVIQLSQIEVENLTDYSTDTLRQFRLEVGSCKFDVYNYDTGVDRTTYKSGKGNYFDSNLYPSIKECLKSQVWEQNEAPSIRIVTKGDDTSLANGDVIGNLSIKDMEGNSLMAKVSITA